MSDQFAWPLVPMHACQLLTTLCFYTCFSLSAQCTLQRLHHHVAQTGPCLALALPCIGCHGQPAAVIPASQRPPCPDEHPLGLLPMARPDRRLHEEPWTRC